MVAERGRTSPLRCPRHCTTTRRLTPRKVTSKGAQSISFWFVELLLLSCLAGGAGDSWHQEVCHYIPPRVVAQQSKWKVRYIHSIKIDTEEHVGKLQWARSSEAVRASLLVKKKKEKGRKGRSRERKQLVVIVPAKWKFLKKVEKLHQVGDQGRVRGRRAQFDHQDVLPQRGLHTGDGRGKFEDDLNGP